MTAFLYIPARDDPRMAQRVDFTNIGSLFVETEEKGQSQASRRLLRIVAAAVIVIVAIGDMLLVTRPDAVASLSAVGGQRSFAESGRTTSL